MNPVLGFDTLSPVSESLIAEVTTELGRPPAFCGRYFSGSDYHGPGEYDAATEGPVLQRHGVPLLPIGRYTTRVGGTLADGQRDGQDQAHDLKVSLGAAWRPGLYLFLDVETDTPLSTAYWTGWAQAVSAAGLLPALYGSVFAGRSTWNALLASPMACAAVWSAYYATVAPMPVPPWTDLDTLPRQSDGTPLSDVPVRLWQYCGDYHGIDVSQVNPAHGDTLMAHLVIPGTLGPVTSHTAKVYTHAGQASVVLDGVVYPLQSLSINGVPASVSSDPKGGV